MLGLLVLLFVAKFRDFSCTRLHKMVQLHIKQGEESLFLYETLANNTLSEIIPIVAKLQNDRRRLERLVSGKKELI